MKLIKQFYQDDNGNIWEIESCSLPKKRGEYKFWTAECKSLSRHYREDNKKRLMIKIKNTKHNENIIN